MRIAVWHNLPSGGGKRALFEQVKGLLARGHQVEAWCPASADTEYLPLADLIVEHVVPFTFEEPSASGRFANVMYSFRSVQNRVAALEQACATCATEIAAGQFDVLFANSCRFHRVPALGRLLRDVPKVLYLHEPYRWLYEALPDLPWLVPPILGSKDGLTLAKVRQALRDWVRLQGLRLQANEERRNAAVYDRILVNSHYSRESVLRAYALDSEVCYLGIALGQFRPSKRPRERFVVGLGSLIHEKGVDIAIRAIATIPQASRPDLVWIANQTSDAYFAKTQALATSLGVRYTVKVMISGDELTELLGRAALMLYTSRLEPFGLAPLEANACETPVVAVAEGGVRETIRHMHNGLVVSDRDPHSLGCAVLSLLDDEALSRELGQRGRDEVCTRWTWEKSIDRLDALLASVVQAHRTGSSNSSTGAG